MMKTFRVWLQKYSHLNWTVIDQVMISGLNFLTGVLVARFLGIKIYGQFVLLYTALLYLNIFQYALILAPMMSRAPQINSDVEKTNYFKNIIGIQLLFSLLLCLTVVVIGTILGNWMPEWNLQNNVIPLGLSVLFFQLQDWLRRYYFIYAKSKAVFINDFISYGGQLAILVGLYYLGKLNIASTFSAIAVSSAIAFLIGIITANIKPVYTHSLQILKHNWKFGKNLLFSGQLYWASSQGILVFGGSILGAQVVGGVRSVQNLVGPLNILFQAMENIIPIRAAQYYAQSQLAGLKKYLKKVSLFGGLLLGISCLGIALLSQQLMELAYGKEYIVFANLIIWPLIVTFVGFFRIQSFYFFRTIGHTKEILFNTIISTALSFVLVMAFVHKLQATGLMLALALSEAISSALIFMQMNKYLRK